MKKTRSRKFQRNVNRNLKDFHLNSRNQDVSKSVPISLDQGKSPPHSSTLEVDILAESFSSLEIDCESINSITSTEEDREDFVIHIGAEIKDWSIRHNITNSATSDLLKILRSHNCFSELPADSRSLLSTPRETSTITVAPGKYVAFEWVRYVKDIVSRNVTKFPSKVVNLQINIDGIPLTKSSSQQFWPILGGILDDMVFKLMINYLLFELVPWSATHQLERTFLEQNVTTDTNHVESAQLMDFILKIVLHFHMKSVQDEPTKHFDQH
ncbi:hypothetical protein Fcan01_10426 [Folsomia candida]|uniref:Uncharacterized protein n=1 Tax=Folsomia candida TaxID=158441 RepID=A0A226EA87_FOLCA|nr:hypothetical protein Fcan01_10426 [Folsomia candida]